MLDTLTYKQKNLLLIPISIILLGISWRFALSNTWDIYSQNQILEKQLSIGSGGPEKLANLKQRLSKLNEKLDNYRFDDKRDKEYILGLASQFCATHHLTLSEFPESVISEEGENTLETLTISAQGAFVNLVKLLYFLEHENKVGRISGAEYYTKLDHKIQQNRLFIKIYIQNIRLKESN